MESVPTTTEFDVYAKVKRWGDLEDLKELALEMLDRELSAEELTKAYERFIKFEDGNVPRNYTLEAAIKEAVKEEDVKWKKF